MTVSLEQVEIPDPREDEIIVRVEASPINPSDLALLRGPADLASFTQLGTADAPLLSCSVPAVRLASVRGRLGQSLPIGNEGAGTVVAAGPGAAGLEGRRVGMFGGAMYADYRRLSSRDVIPLPDGASAADGASMFINPLTALGFVETARNEGHTAIVHTAAASNLGQMLQKICLVDNIPLINIVRSQAQVEILRGIGAVHVLNSADDDFTPRLAALIEQTGATIAFDAIGGGMLGSDILQAMEQASVQRMTEYNRYGSETFKHLYLYGALDLKPTTLNRLTFGFEWSVSGWLLFHFLRKAGSQVEDRLRKRVADELTTTFASHYTRTVGLAEALQPDLLRAYARLATGEKFLIDPTRG
ncbi:zinc-binding dehydrogenase [Sphingomonas sp. Root710]|uniref:zinc-binding dehydrogenase n=1 Tax=Sphingomonas sp. Root710 TaxID=1736594 RepID=UPI001F16DC45|nr:zinc-binding dehydrogenase [Sphingomonas sp. Root710]